MRTYRVVIEHYCNSTISIYNYVYTCSSLQPGFASLQLSFGQAGVINLQVPDLLISTYT